MTKEEAIYRLKNTAWLGSDADRVATEEAVRMAIEALKLASNLHQTCVTDAKGHWIIFPPFIEEICMCSNCKTKFKEAYQHRDTCPNCGARMEV